MGKSKKLDAEETASYGLMIVCIIALVLFCNYSLQGRAGEDYPEIRSRLPLDNADSIDISCAGSCVKGDEAVVWYIAGDGEYYVPLECSVINYEEYQLIDFMEAMSVNIDDVIYVPWKDGFSVIVNNENCIGYETVSEDGSVRSYDIPPSSIPYIMFVDDISSCSFMMTE